jgi:NADPH:quinone reductase-like Zn-dependent oxidoreductase
MKAIVQERFGSPDVLEFVDTDLPRIGADEVLVRVHAAALNPYDWHVLRGDPYVARLMGAVGMTKPKARVAGVDGAGRVEAVGADVHGLGPGDEVLGRVEGAFAEYARARADTVVPKPPSLTFEQAAAVPMAGQTALRAIRVATALGAEVTGVSGTRNLELVRSLGAAHVIDHTRDDFTDERQRYDVILDNVGNQPLRRLRRALTPTGTLVSNAGGSPSGSLFGPMGPIVKVIAVNAFVRQRLRPLPDTWTREHLLAVTELIEAGHVTPVLDRTFPLADSATGLRHLEEGHARGKVVITVI